LPRITIRTFIEEFKHIVEAEAVNSFWDSRTRRKLKNRPEKHGQELLGVFASAKLAGRGSARLLVFVLTTLPGQGMPAPALQTSISYFLVI
jgi:hypothetical protein